MASTLRPLPEILKTLIVEIEQVVATSDDRRDTREAHWFDRIFLARDPSLDFGDQFLGSSERFGILPRTQAYTVNTSVALPDGISGNFYILVFTDSVWALDMPCSIEVRIPARCLRILRARATNAGNVPTRAIGITVAAPASRLAVRSVRGG